MVIAGLIGFKENGKQDTNLFNILPVAHNKKTSIINSISLIEMGATKAEKYFQEIRNNGTDILILKININDIYCEAFDYLRLDIILYSSRCYKDMFLLTHSTKIKKLLTLLNEKGILIINEDFFEKHHFPKEVEYAKFDTVTYGFNSKSNITTSSVGDMLLKKGLVLYQQKPINALNGKRINPQEYRFEMKKENTDIYEALSAVAFAVACGIELNVPDTYSPDTYSARLN
jgi:hypothetical protein